MACRCREVSYGAAEREGPDTSNIDAIASNENASDRVELGQV